MKFDLEICRTHTLQAALPKATPSTHERHAKCFCKPHGQSCAATLSQSTHGMSLSRVHPPPFSTLTTLTLPSARYRGSKQPQSAGRRYGVSARLDGELDEDAFGVGLHGLGANLQLFSDPFVGKPTAHRAQDAVLAGT